MLDADILQLLPDNSHLPQSPKVGTSDSDGHLSSKIKRIIVVDDEMLIAESLVEILRLEGFQAIAVSDGSAAIKWAEFLEPEAVICDIAMPGTDGFEVARQIRRLLPTCRIILFSGHAGVQRRLAEVRIENRDFEFLAKPVRPEIIIKMLKDPKQTD